MVRLFQLFLIPPGPCQFPTLGFIVDRFWKAKCHQVENFYSISCTLEKDGCFANLKWRRGRLFDKAACFILYEMCIDDPMAKVLSMNSKPIQRL